MRLQFSKDVMARMSLAVEARLKVIHALQEEEERLKPGAHKSILFLILKEAGADGMNVQQMVGAAKQRGLKEYDGSNRRVLSEVCL